MKVAVELLDFVNRRRSAGMNSEEGDLSLVDISTAHHVLTQKLYPTGPVGAIRQIHQDDRHKLSFAGLCQGDRFQKLIVRAKATGKDHNSVGFFDEHELARKKEVKVHQLWIFAN